MRLVPSVRSDDCEPTLFSTSLPILEPKSFSIFHRTHIVARRKGPATAGFADVLDWSCCAPMSLLTYSIAACSSEDESHPARELQSFHSQSRGWQTAHFCDFPQELVLRFGGAASVQQVQVLSHQFKIATRVELFIGKLPPGAAEPPPSGVGGVAFTRLGHFSLDGNERSKFQARELKTVYVPRLAEGHFLKLLLHKCHVNEHNLYNQVGVLAIRVVRRRVERRHVTLPRPTNSLPNANCHFWNLSTHARDAAWRGGSHIVTCYQCPTQCKLPLL
jgi:hypothetical protein